MVNYQVKKVQCTTVLSFKSCTKCVGTSSPSIINDRTHDCHPVSVAWMHGWPRNKEHRLDSQATWVTAVHVLGLSFIL